MTAYNVVVLLILAMISALHCLPIEVVYTGESCDCPKSLNYQVNVPPPVEEKETTRSEHGYKLDVPVQAKAKVTYSFDFTVQEPKTPAPPEDDKWDLYAKVDRITAHKKDCTATTETRSATCNCGDKCECSRCRYVSPVERAVRSSLANSDHPNSVSKRLKRRPVSLPLSWTAIVKPLNDEQTPIGVATVLKRRRKRGLSRLFGLNLRPQIEKRPDRMVKQYNKRLEQAVAPTPTLAPKFGQNFKPFQAFPAMVANGKGPFAKFREMMLAHHNRNKRDIKGEYDLLEKEREQLDLTLPEIIQFMPETLDPNFKRGRCQFVHCQQLQQQAEEELLHRIAPNKVSDRTTNSSLNSGADSEVSTEKSDSAADNETANGNANDSKDNEIGSSSHRKRNADIYRFSHIQHFTSPAPTAPGYYMQSYDIDADIIPRPFAIARNHYGSDPAPQQYVGAPQIYANHRSLPPPPPPVAMARSMGEEAPQFAGGPIYNPAPPGYYANAQLDRVIADIVSQHLDFLDAGSHRGAALVDPVPLQDHHTKSFLKMLSEGRFHKLFADDDITLEYHRYPPPNYRYPPQYSSAAYY